MSLIDDFTVTVAAAAAFERHRTLPLYEDRPTLADAYDERPPVSLPDPYLCLNPWCPNAPEGRHLHGTRPDGVRV